MKTKRDSSGEMKIVGRLLLGVSCGVLAPISLKAGTTNHVAIVNPSFETPVLAGQNAYAYFDGAAGWINDSSAGVMYPFDVYLPAGGKDGVNVMFVNNLGGGHQTIGLDSLTLRSNTKLILKVRIGCNSYYPPQKSYYDPKLTFADRTVKPSPSSSDMPDLITGGFVTWTLTYVIPPDGFINGVNVAGENVTIELFKASAGNTLYYDLVSLDEVVLPGGPLSIVHVPVVNPSFETPALSAEDAYAYFDGTAGWVNDNAAGAIHPYAVYFPNGGIDGVNVMFVNGVGGGHQTLPLSSLTLQPRTELTLSVRVLCNSYYPPQKSYFDPKLTFADRTVSPTPIRSNTPDLVQGGAVLWNLTYAIPSSGLVNGVNVVGQNATIELCRPVGGVQINYDLVKLDVVTYPPAGTVVVIN
ncbi:MAG: hypothetical protein PHR35_00950 [Kiritimatiellae bacterium]|nr:hypothetical protein [Kiritimatiellia bacterium]